MKWVFLLLVGVAAFTAIAADVEDDLPELPADLNDLDDLDEEEDILGEFMMQAQMEAEARPVDNSLKPVVEIDPCEKMHCGAGRICQLNGEEAECVCIPECPTQTDDRRHVCSNKNETWPSDCSVYQQRCLCENNAPGCLNPDNVHLHIDYYGSCHALKECTEEEMADFPHRMRQWLFNVMRDLAERDELTEHYMQMQLEAETNMTRRWANAAVWKWCDLDGNTDRTVSLHELFPIRAPLVSLEHCIAPFLESCDSNNDHRITLIEWGACLELEEDDLNERCDTVQKSIPHLLG